MGDIADEHYDRMADDMLTDFGGWLRVTRHTRRPRDTRTRCARCGGDITFLGGQPRPVDTNTGAAHTCPNTADGFEDEPT